MVVSDNINVKYIIGQSVCGKRNLEWKKIEFKISFKLPKLTRGEVFWLRSKFKGVVPRCFLLQLKWIFFCSLRIIICAGLHKINYNINLHIFGKVSFFPPNHLSKRKIFLKFIFSWSKIAFNIVLVSAVQQWRSAIIICISPPSWPPLLSPPVPIYREGIEMQI